MAPATDVAGIARIRLSPQTKSGDRVGLQLVTQRNLRFISPWDSQVIVPRFDGATEVLVVLASVEQFDFLARSSSKASLTANSQQKAATPPGTIQPKAQNDGPSGGMEHYPGLVETPGILALASEERHERSHPWSLDAGHPQGNGPVFLYSALHPGTRPLLSRGMAFAQAQSPETGDGT